MQFGKKNNYLLIVTKLSVKDLLSDKRNKEVFTIKQLSRNELQFSSSYSQCS